MLLVISSDAAADQPERNEPKLSVGPWGTVEFYEVEIEPPASQLWPGLFDERSVWEFPDMGKEEVIGHLRLCGVSEPVLDAVSGLQTWNFESKTSSVEVTDEIVQSLTETNRLMMGRWWDTHHNSFYSKLVINLNTEALAAMELRLPPEQCELIRSTLFRQGRMLDTFDRPFLLRQLANEKEKQQLIRTLFTNHSVIARLVISEEEDLESLIEYWSGNGQNEAVESILRGVQATPGVDKIDLIQLFPPLPKKYLYSFTRHHDLNVNGSPDCFWAAFHFFQPYPSGRPLDSLSREHYFEREFTRVESSPEFGDLAIVSSRETGKFIHSYIYVTDEIVFTKNGSSPARPFTLTLKSVMMAAYEEEKAVVTEVFRKTPET